MMKSTAQFELPKDAAGWDAHLRSSDCTADERHAFSEWYAASEQNAQEYEQLRHLLGELRASSNAPEIRALREWALDNEAPGRSHRMLRWGGGAIAATVFLAAGLWALNLERFGFTSPPEINGNVFTTAIGERSTVNLDDGSVAELNTNSELIVDYSDSERRIVLKEGQAFFDVAKATDRPFVVFAGEQTITAIGTAFDVLYIDDTVEVTLVEGVVDIAPASKQNLFASTIQPIQMTAGQELKTSAIVSTSAPVIADVNTDHNTVWRTGRAFFEDASLAEAVEEMNRYSSIKIKIEDTSLSNVRMNGMFRTGEQENFVETLVAYYSISAVQTSDDTITLRMQ